jgi:hypothetical protein
MNKKQIRQANIAQLVAAYREAAQTQGLATESGDYKVGNKASDLLAKIYSEIRSRGRESQHALLPLLADEDSGVRLWAASHALDFSSEKAEPVLESLVPVGKFLGLCAKTTLEEWRAGRLSFP